MHSRGATSKDMLSYAQPTLDRENSDAILIHVGINVVIVKRKTPIDIADSILSVGRQCKDGGINEVIISSITRTKRSRFQMKINKVNSVLKNLCLINDFIFIDNVNINDCYDDLLHLKYFGTCRLANNFLKVINKVLDTRNC